MLKLILSVGWLMVSLQLTIAAFSQPQQELIAEGDHLAAAWDNEAALTRYSMVFAEDSMSWEINLRMTSTSIDVAEDAADDRKHALLRDAMRLGERFTMLFPDSSQPWLQSAIAYGHLALFEGGREKVRLSRDVERNLLMCLAIEPDNWRARGILGKYYLEIANLSWALKTVANVLLGGLPEGSLEMAERELQRSLQLNPDYVYARLQLGRTWLSMGNNEQARAELERAIKLAPHDHMDATYQREARQLLD
jgi:tetratricopeptide (TPR) repeat protein